MSAADRHPSDDTLTADARGPTGSDIPAAMLRKVLEAIPEATLVIDSDYRVRYANHAARVLAGREDFVPGYLTCHQFSHQQDLPCEGGTCLCPLREVIARKTTVTVVHTHRRGDGREVFVEVTAAPILGDTGQVVQVLETWRDITERKWTRQLLEIANRHADLAPLLEEFAAEIRHFTGCEAVGIRILDDELSIPYYASLGFSPEFCLNESRLCLETNQCLCISAVRGTLNAGLPCRTEAGSFHTGSLTGLLASVPSQMIGPMRSTCLDFGYESIGLVPIRLGDEILGLIQLADRSPNAILPETVEALERAAMPLGTAIQRARAEEALRQTHAELEVTVQARTAQLAAANQSLEQEICERNRLEREVLLVASREQQRIGQDLHDGLGQELTGLGYLAKTLHQRLRTRHTAEAEIAAELSQGLPQVLTQVQTIVKGLLPLELGAEDFLPALQDLVRRTEERSGVPCSCAWDCRTLQPVRDRQTAFQLYRIAQEALTNAVKHGRPGRVVVTLREEPNRIVLEILDDGLGASNCVASSGGSGLQIMSYRARAIGARVDIRHPPAGGTLVRCLLPQE